MNLWSIAIKSVKQRALASALTSLSVALGVMLMIVVLVATVEAMTLAASAISLLLARIFMD